MTLQVPEHHAFSVGAQRQEVMFRDGSAITLHPVFERGEIVMYHRAVQLRHGVTMVVDLRRLAKQLTDDLCFAATRDVPGIVFFTLRQIFPTADLAVRQIVAQGSVLPEVHGVAA